MPEYVYALHDFLPEHEDEVDFRAGERIEVVEKDDLYGDGWWQGRNLAGKLGLFPQSYTTPAPPVSEQLSTVSNGDDLDIAPVINSRPALQTLAEESEGESPIRPHIASPIPKPPPIAFLNGDDSDHEIPPEDSSATADGEMMKATLTDVQKAIEQLGRNRVDGDGGRSFSFASTQDGASESDFDLSDVDILEDVGEQGDWHKGARRKLAEKARKAVEEAQILEAMMNNGSERRSTAPPIDVELSDDSDEEGDSHELDKNDFTSSSFPRKHPYIPEEDEDELVPTSVSFKNETDLSKHQQEISTGATATPQLEAEKSLAEVSPTSEGPELPTATLATFPKLPASPTIPASPVFIPQSIEKSETAPAFSPPLMFEETRTPLDSKRNSAPILISRPLSNLPSPTVSSHASGFGLSIPFDGASSSSISQSISTNPTTTSTQTPVDDKKEKKHPSDWSMEEVIDWLKARGFDQDVCDKFTEQEITGDVLLDLDVNILKAEIGILAFGKRMRIANAIAELRRPPSITSYEPSQDLQTPSSVVHQPPAHSRTLSQTHSHRSFPGTPMYASSFGSPIMHSVSANGPLAVQSEAHHVNGNGIGNGNGTISAAIINSGAAMAGVGLGLGGPESEMRTAKTRPAQLTISPSESALKDRIILEGPTTRTPEDDRAHMSDGDFVSSTSVRRRLFGRSHDSSLSVGAASSRQSRDGNSPAPSSMKDTFEKEKDKDKESFNTTVVRHRTKKSLDSKGGERLSIFGSTFGGSLSKGRKPPPSEDSMSDSKSNSMFSRLHGSSIRKASSNRPTTPGGSPKSSPIDTKEKIRSASSSVTRPATGAAEDRLERHSSERATLRKRTVSGPAAQTIDVIEPTGEIKPGLSILEQVGEPDHTGWMRKKAVRYNTWKLRYFVLKGEHLYILRANNKTETRLKGYVNIRGYRVTVDETLDPGRYCFRIDHDHDKTHFFSSEEKSVIREWMKAIMKATIGRDYTKPVVSSCNIPTIPLVVAQAMNPAPRPPSPGARDATQKALRRENPNQLSSRDARVLMGLPHNTDPKDERKNVQNFFTDELAIDGSASIATTPKASVPPRPSREMRRMDSTRSTINSAADETLIDWGNQHLPESLQVTDSLGPLFGGLHLLRIAESIKGKPASPPVPDSAFPLDATDDKLDGLFKLFDFLLDNDVKMGSVSINDIRQNKRDKILQLLRALKAWEDKRRALSLSMGSSVQAGGFMVPVGIHY